MEKRILISTTTFAEFDRLPLNLLKQAGFAYTLNPYRRKLSEAETVELGKGAVGIIAGVESLSGKVLQKLLKLKVISRCGSGLDNVDLASAQKAQIKVYNTAETPARAVAELTLGLILNLLRHLNQADQAIRQGNWQKKMGVLLYNKKVGIVGLGRIGKKLARLLSAFDCEIAYADPYVNQTEKELRRLPLEELLGWADIVSLHISGKDKIFGKEQLQLMKKGAWLINTSRGNIVDEAALYQALKQRHLAGCALDVFEQEPYRGPLKELDNVLLTPHIGSYAKETRVQMEKQAVENLLRGLEEKQ